MPLPESFHVKRMRQNAVIFGLERRNAFCIKAARALGRLFHFPEASLVQDLGKITEIECRAVLPITEQKVREAPSQRIEMPWKPVFEPVGALLLVGENRAVQARNDQAQPCSGLEHSGAFVKQPV